MGKIQLIDAETLYYKPLEHPKMLIDGVLSDRPLRLWPVTQKSARAGWCCGCAFRSAKESRYGVSQQERRTSCISHWRTANGASSSVYAGPDGYSARQPAFRLLLRSARCRTGKQIEDVLKDYPSRDCSSLILFRW